MSSLVLIPSLFVPTVEDAADDSVKPLCIVVIITNALFQFSVLIVELAGSANRFWSGRHFKASSTCHDSVIMKGSKVCMLIGLISLPCSDVMSSS